MCEPFNDENSRESSPPSKRQRVYKRSRTREDEAHPSPLWEGNTEEIAEEITSESQIDDVTVDISSNITLDNTALSSKEEGTYLYLSEEMYDRLISSTVEEDNDITFHCTETTTKEGFRVLVYRNNDIQSMEEEHTIIDKLLFQVPPMEPDTTNSSIECMCNVCGVMFTEAKRLQIHLALYHSTGANTLLRCWVCEKNCEEVTDYLAHIKQLHPEVIFKCPVCGDVTGSMKSLSTHINNAHFNTAKYCCDYCGAKFRSPHTKQYHIKNKHLQGNTTRICDICMKVFQHERSLLRHMKQIHEGKREICTVCNQTYSSLSSLYVHQRSKHNKVSYKCGFCSLSFKSPASVTRHEAEMHEVSRTLSQASTERMYHYRHVVDENSIVKRARRGESTKHITCNNCKTEFTCHDAYTKHCKKFHTGEY